MEHEHSPEYIEKIPEVQALERFYSDVSSGESYVDFKIALGAYLQAQLENKNIELDLNDAIAARVVIEEFSYDINSREGKEQFLLVPLMYVAPFIEKHCSVEDITEWYAWATAIATYKGDDFPHDEHCLAIIKKNKKSCKHNAVCPLRVTRSVLLQDIEPSQFVFSGDKDASRERILVQIKLGAAIQNNVITRQAAGTYWQKYQHLRDHAVYGTGI